jgi:geranylgeranyl diphosphate synthase type II
VLGKTAGKDERAGKATFPALYGLDGSRRRAKERVDRGCSALADAGLLDERLEALARFTLARGG